MWKSHEQLSALEELPWSTPLSLNIRKLGQDFIMPTNSFVQQRNVEDRWISEIS
jgi:hypothetical protein